MPALRRVPERPRPPAARDRGAIHRILDAGRVAHVAFSVRARPLVVPMFYVREGDTLLLHGTLGGRLLQALGGGASACVSVALVDGLVLARSHANHAMNYRSVVAHGRATAIVDASEKAAALARLVDALVPGRAHESRAADAGELQATALLRFAIEDASAQGRSGPPRDAPCDAASPAWAGVLPLRAACDDALPAPGVQPHAPLPDSLRRLLGSMPAAWT